MLSISLSFLQLALPIAVGLAVAAYLHDVTQRLLVDLCGTEDRARFWARCSVIAMLAVPLMLVLMAADIPHEYATNEVAGYAMHVVRQALAWTAGGILASVGVVASAVGQRIPREIEPSQPTGGAS